jgi:hypothetical protein
MQYRTEESLAIEENCGDHGCNGLHGCCLTTLPTVIPRNGHRWGNWRLSTSRGIPSLDFIGKPHSRACPYEIVLSRIFSPEDTYRDSRGFVGWIKHLHGKSWGREGMSDFVDAVLTIGCYGYMHGRKHVLVWEYGTSEGECRLVWKREVE